MGNLVSHLLSFPHQNTLWPLEMEFVVSVAQIRWCWGSLSRPESSALGGDPIFTLRNTGGNSLVCLMAGSTSHFTT